ncbi:type I-B CRISPR-associated protein Cas8b1/Cst1 [Methanobrevibacter sp. UBA337]|uniref:type I-B CRISPR-associated protein Cas8b1/Cst1 n=1 Tax=Methanobrevibacter sp. UBA337 TaxID=1915480 RepID=UPI0039B9310B
MKGLIDNISPCDDSGDCMACGRRNTESSVFKSNVPLTGSGSLKNYFSFANDGADYCNLCTLLIQFSPLVMYASGGKMILLHSDSSKVMTLWCMEALSNVLEQESTYDYTGCFNEGYVNPQNAVFKMITDIIQEADEEWDDEYPSLNFYYFTNYNQGPELEIFNVPTNVFRFLTYIPPDEYFNWNQIVRKGYIVNWNKVKDLDDYKNKRNTVYNNLLINKTILYYFFDRKYKKAYCSWNLLRFYMMEVRKLTEERLEVIKSLGDSLSDYIKKNEDKKTLKALEAAKNYREFRNVLRKVIKKKIANNDKELLFTYDDYVNYLFPDGNLTWRETQDLLLFRIYENLHEWLVDEKFVDEYDDETDLEEE